MRELSAGRLTEGEMNYSCAEQPGFGRVAAEGNPQVSLRPSGSNSIA